MHALSFLCVLVLFGSSYGALQSSVSTFVLVGNSKEVISAKLTTSDGIPVECSLEYDTSVVSDTTKQYPPVATVVAEMNKKYGCLERPMGIFTYKVCLGDRIDQIADNGDRYSLGVYERLDTAGQGAQFYVEGTFCDAAHTSRKTTVEFTCAAKGYIMELHEPSVCSYKIIIGAPEVCGHPMFSVTSQLESWLLEVAETDDGAVVCQAYNNGFDVVGTTSFSKFSLSFSDRALSLLKYAVRQKNRVAVADSDLQIDVSPARVKTRSMQQVDYAKIVAQ